MKYNPFAYLRSEKDILKLVNTIIANTKGDGEKSGEDFWVKAEKLYYTALIGYIWYEAPDEEKNFTTLLEMINASEAREDDEDFKNPVDLMFERLEEKDPEHFAVKQYKKYKLAAGETWRYFRDSDCKKAFTLDSVTADDIISANQFEKEFVVQEEGYYYGHVANGSYNDDTGHAYYVQYFRDGTVKTLYVGRFIEGKFDDSTGEAWMLGKINENAPYSYYKGVFQAGKSIKDSRYWEEPLSLDRVREIVACSGLTFNCTLKWERDKL